MDLRCPTCSAAYSFDEARIPSAGFDVRCTVCETVFRVAPPAPAPYWVRPTPRDEPVPFPSLEAIHIALARGTLPPVATFSRDGERYAPIATLPPSVVSAPPPTAPSQAAAPAPRPSARTAPLGTAHAIGTDTPHAPIRITGDLHAIPDREPPTVTNDTVLFSNEVLRARSPLGDALPPAQPAPPRSPAPPRPAASAPRRSTPAPAPAPRPAPAATPVPPSRRPAPPQRITARSTATPQRDRYTIGEAADDSGRWSLGGASDEVDPLDLLIEQRKRRSTFLLRTFVGIVLLGAGVLVGVAIAAPHKLGLPWAADTLSTEATPTEDTPPAAQPPETAPSVESSVPEGSTTDPSPDDGASTPARDEGTTTASTGSNALAEPALEPDPDVAQERAIPAATTSVDATPRRSERAPSDNERLRLGRAALEGGRLDEALTHFSAAADRGGSVEAHTGVADTYAAMGRYDVALARYERATRVGSRYQPAWFGLARMQERAGRRDAAIAAYREVIAIRNSGRHAQTASAALQRLGVDPMAP
jgi:predicted Zn finger-like uncharacterized protein